jgi:hypothetical protein
MKRQWLLIVGLLAVVALHIVSLSTLVRYYARSYVVDLNDGAATLYWGGEKDSRDNFIYNASEWPPRPETHFAGGQLAECQRWETYGPGLLLRSYLSDRIKYRGVLHALGCSLPQLRCDEEGASVILPLGTIAFLFEFGALLLIVGVPPNVSTTMKTLWKAAHLRIHATGGVCET